MFVLSSLPSVSQCIDTFYLWVGKIILLIKIYWITSIISHCITFYPQPYTHTHTTETKLSRTKERTHTHTRYLSRYWTLNAVMCGNSSWVLRLFISFFVTVVVVEVLENLLSQWTAATTMMMKMTTTTTALKRLQTIFSIQMKCKKDNKIMAWNQRRRRATTTTTRYTNRQTQSSAA